MNFVSNLPGAATLHAVINAIAATVATAKSQRHRETGFRLFTLCRCASVFRMCFTTPHYSSTTIVIFMFPWFAPQKWSQMVVNVPAT